MAINKKGGHITIDFKDEGQISDVKDFPTQLKRDYYKMISNTYGKTITLINVLDSFADLMNCAFVDGIELTDTYVDLYVSRPNPVMLRITKDNKAYVEEV